MSDENKNKSDLPQDAGENDDVLSDDLSLKNSDLDKQKDTDDSVTISKSKVILVKKLLANIKENSDKLSQILSTFLSEEDEDRISIGQSSDETFEASEVDASDGKIIEGVFDGENMVGPDGKQYSVPANYASKSKMVEGDILKLTITAKGTFVYKQISPIERIRVIGQVDKGSDGNFYVTCDDLSSSAGKKKWRVLTASVTYFKGESGDEAVILIPKAGDSKWAAVENVVRKQ